MIATCKEQCDDAYTTNGLVVTPKTCTKKSTTKAADGTTPCQTWTPEPSREYGVCTACDIPCATCEGQKAPLSSGKPGDTAKCTSCTAEFRFAVEAEQTCFVSCPSGYYEVRNEQDQIVIGKEACKKCELPCLSCITTATTC